MDVTLALLFGVVISGSLAAYEWKYEGPKGPEMWDDTYETCGGRAQSPINIDTTELIYDEFLASNDFVFHGYDSADNLAITMSNSGHSVQLLFKGDQRYVTGGNLPGRYNLLQLHFHWGSADWKGSEHALDGRLFPLEMHIVHTSEVFNVSTALVSPNGLAVLGFFFEIGDYDNPVLNRLLDHFDAVEYKGGEVTLDSFPIGSLMPENRQHFYRYQGSLTTPGCFESVIWTVFDQPIMISERQMDLFRKIQEYEAGEGVVDYMYDNFRPLQELNGRPVYTTEPYQDRWNKVSGASALTSSIVALLACGIYSLL